MDAIRLLATDLDGTLIGSTDEFHLYAEFEELLTTLRAQYGLDRVRNAVHCTDLPEDGLLEVEHQQP